MHSGTRLSSLLLSIVLLLAVPARAVEGTAFQVVPRDAQAILLARDHYSVELVKGWVSSKDSFFKALLSGKTKLVISIRADAEFFDGGKNTLAILRDNSDIRRDTDRPWGVNKVLLERVPGDAKGSVDLLVTIERQDRLKAVFAAILAAEPKASVVDGQAWAAYSSLISAITTTLFGTERKDYPFTWLGDIQRGPVLKDGTLMEHFVIVIAPNRDGDPLVKGLDASKLSYDEGSQQVRYQGQPLLDHSYAVLNVKKAAGYDIPRLILESQAPWAVLGRGFLALPILDLNNRDQLVGLAKQTLGQLNTEIDLLTRERRFSAFDRAVALRLFAIQSRDTLSRWCASLGIQPYDCPTSEIDQFIHNIERAAGLPPQLGEELRHASEEAVQQLQLQLQQLQKPE
jgi:hypothetical protein